MSKKERKAQARWHLPATLIDRIDLAAEAEKISPSQWVARTLHQALESDPELDALLGEIGGAQ